jgi:hypothetical protein
MFQGDQVPSIGYLETDEITCLRRRTYRLRPFKEPADALKDPYIVAVLIALAQAQCRKRGDAFTGAPVSYILIFVCGLEITGFSSLPSGPSLRPPAATGHTRPSRF